MPKRRRFNAVDVEFEWYDSDDRTWHITATVTAPVPGTWNDPPEGGEVEDMTFELEQSLMGGLNRKLSFTYEQFYALFRQEGVDSVEQKAFDTASDKFNDDYPDDDYDEDPPEREWKGDW